MTTPPGRAQPAPRSRYPLFRTLTTRWMDNDVYGHLNNVVHYSLFDSAVNGHLIEAGALDIHRGEVIGLVVSTRCDYFEGLAFPQTVHAGLRLLHRGRASVRYEIGLFGDDAPLAAAVGEFVHVYVDRATRRPVAVLPPALDAALRPLQGPDPLPVEKDPR
jgi:acyl-CoA thioester hydrolase